MSSSDRILVVIETLESETVGSELWHDAAVAAAELIGDAMRNGSVDDDEITRLTETLAGVVARHHDHTAIGPAVWALGKLADPNHHALFDRVLETQLDNDGEALYQTLIALNNLGEMEQHQSWAHFEVEENRRRARAYLGSRP